MKKLVCITTLLIVTPCLASSYTFILDGIPSESPSLVFSFKHPIMDHMFIDVSTLSGTYELSGNFALSEVLDAMVCLPYVTSSEEGESTRRALGNITVGIRSSYQHWQEKGWTGSITMSLPVMSDDEDAAYIGSIGRLTEYFRGFGKYSPEILTIDAVYSSVNRLNMTNIILGFEIGPALWIPVGGVSMTGGSEVFLQYGLVGSLDLNSVSVSLEAVGLMNVTGSIAEVIDHAVVLGGHWLGSAIKPGVFYQVNIGTDINDFIDGVFGIDVEIGL